MSKLKVLGVVMVVGAACGGKTTGGTAARSANGDLSYLPTDSAIVVGADVARVRTSALGTRLWAEAVGEVIHESFDSDAPCLRDAFGAVTSATGALAGRQLTVVVHGPLKNPVLACFRTLITVHPDGSSMQDDMVVMTDELAIGLGFIDDDTALLLVRGDDHPFTIADVGRALAPGPGLGAVPLFVSQRAALPASPTAWLVAPNARSLSGLESIASGRGSAELGEPMTFAGTMDVEDPQVAAELMAGISDFNRELAEIGVAPLDSAQTGGTITVEGRLSSADLDKVLKH